MKNPVSASNAVLRIKKKLGLFEGAPQSATPRKRKIAKSADEDEGVDDAEETPTKKRRARVKKEIKKEEEKEGNGAVADEAGSEADPN